MGSLTFTSAVGLIVAGLSTVAHAAKLETVAPFPNPKAVLPARSFTSPRKPKRTTFRLKSSPAKP